HLLFHTTQRRLAGTCGSYSPFRPMCVLPSPHEAAVRCPRSSLARLPQSVFSPRHYRLPSSMLGHSPLTMWRCWRYRRTSPPSGRGRGTANPQRLCALARHWPPGHWSGAPPAGDIVRDSRHSAWHTPIVPTMVEKARVLCDGASFGLEHRLRHSPPFAHCIPVGRGPHRVFPRVSLRILTYLRCGRHAWAHDTVLHPWLWGHARPLPYPHGQRQDVAPWGLYHDRPECQRSWGRAMPRRLSLVAIGIPVHAWAVRRLPAVHDMGAAPGKK